MFSTLFDVLFPKYCVLCKRNGSYLCRDCLKLFKKRLPECYICRTLSQDFQTHSRCKRKFSLDRVYVIWEYDRYSSQILKRYKYTGVYDIGRYLSELFIDSIPLSLEKYLEDTLLVPIPSSICNYNERGFKHTDIIAKFVSKKFRIDICTDILKVSGSNGHQSLRDKNERINIKYIVKKKDLSKYKSITILDDVITTGRTLDSACIALKRVYNIDVQALCLFRGKPYYF